MKFTTASVANLELPPGKDDALFWDSEIPGLGIRLRSSGRKLWVFQYRVGTRQRRMTLGVVSAIGVAEARKQATQIYAKTRLGQDPAAAKDTDEARAAETVGGAIALYLTRQRARLRPRSFASVERHLMRTAKVLHRMTLTEVDRRAIAAVLTRVEAGASGATVNRTRTSLLGFFTWAVHQGLLDSNPVSGTEHRDEVGRDRLLEDAEIAAIWAGLGQDDYAAITRLLLLTGARRSEIANLQWSEVDLEQALITIPPERVKNKREHVIALSEPALAILRARPRNGAQVFGWGKNGFAAWRDGKVRLERSLSAAGVAMPPAWVLHDFRRFMSTAMHERLGILPHVVEACLGHVGHQGGVAGRYNKATYLAEKTIAMTRWGEFVMAVVEKRDAKVISLRA
jgi:integrase